MIIEEFEHDGMYNLNALYNYQLYPRHKAPVHWKCSSHPVELAIKNGRIKTKSIKGRYGKTLTCKDGALHYAKFLGGEVYKSVCNYFNVDEVGDIVTAPRQFVFGEDIVNNLFSDYTILKEFGVCDGKYGIDWYIPELKLAIEFDEEHHKNQSAQDKQRQLEIENELGCRFIRYTL